MKNYKIAILFVVILVGGSCKQSQKTLQGGEKNTTRNIRNDGNKNQMTASRAKEEEMFVQGCIEKSLGNSRKALVQFQECLKINPQSAATNFEMAGIYREFEQTDRALLFAKKAVEFAPTNRWYVLRYAELLQENKMYVPAVVVFKNLSDRESNNVDLLFRYAGALARAEKFDDALKKYNEIEIIEGVSDTLQMCRIVVYKKQLDIIGEENALVTLSKAFPKSMEYKRRLADFYYSTGQSEKASLVFKKMIASFPNSAVPHLLLAGNYNKIKDDENAFTEARCGFLISEESSLTLKINVLAELYSINDSAAPLSTIKYKRADSLCAILMRVHQNKPEPFVASGNYQFKRGKMTEARDMYFKAIDRGQIDYSTWKKIMAIHNNLNDTESQTKTCMTILELFPSQPAPYYYLGIIQLNKKNYAGAIRNLEMANDFLNENTIDELKITMALIDAYRGDGKNEKAATLEQKINTKLLNEAK